MKNPIFIFILGVLFFASSCREKDKPVEEEPMQQAQIEVTIEPFYGSLPLVSENVIFTTQEGYSVKLREMKIILTDLHNGNSVLSDAGLYDFKKGKTLLKVNGTSANFGNLSFNIGVPDNLNHADPAAFPNDHPLNILNASDMHWSWNPGYIFVKIEMIADTSLNQMENFNHIISFHVGMDEAFRQSEFSNLTWNNAGNGLEQLRLKVDFETLLHKENSTVDLKTESSTHSAPAQMPLSLKLADNFKSALSPL